jgi:hypothetical protein
MAIPVVIIRIGRMEILPGCDKWFSKIPRGYLTWAATADPGVKV